MNEYETYRAKLHALEAERDAAAIIAVEEGSFTPEEKCAAFDTLRERALEHARRVIKVRWKNRDEEHYIYEAVMLLTLRPDIFKILNPFCG